MDPLSITASTLSFLGALKTAWDIGSDFFKAGTEREDFQARVDDILQIKNTLKFLIEGNKKDDPKWVEYLNNLVPPLTQLGIYARKMQKIIQTKKSPWKQKVKNAMWNSDKESLKDIFKAVDSYVGKINMILISANIMLSRDQVSVVRDTNEIVKKSAASDALQRNKQHREEEEIERKAIEEWLSPLDYQNDQRQLFKNSVQTGSWFFDLPMFEHWKKGSTDLLKCYGKKGTGKTVLSSILVSHLNRELSAKYPVLCVYLEEHATAPQTPNHIIGSLIKQLIQFKGVGGVSTDIYKAWKKGIRIGDHLLQDLMELLKAELQLHDRVYVVVDALDASPEETRKFIEGPFTVILPERMKILTLTRPVTRRTPYLIACDVCLEEKAFYFRCSICPRSDMCGECMAKDKCCPTDTTHTFVLPNFFEVDIIPSKKDLTLYVEHIITKQMPENQNNPREPDLVSRGNPTTLGIACYEDLNLMNKIVTAIVESSGEKFLLSKLYINSLSDLLTEKHIEKAVAEIEQMSYSLSDPDDRDNDINRLYEEDLKKRIEGQDSSKKRVLAKRILSIVYHAKRYLKLEELNHALATEPGDSFYNPKGEYNEDLIYNSVKGFVTIGKDSERLVRLDDRTLYDYFDIAKDYWFPTGKVDMANICLNYLGFDDFVTPCLTEEFSKKEKKYHFLSYAVEYWGEHACEAGEEVAPAVIQFLQHKSRLQAYIQAAYETNTNGIQKWDVRRDVHALHVCSWFDFDKIILSLFDIDVDVTEDTYGQTPLMYACRRGNIATAKQLMSLGATLNITSGRGRTALQEAVLCQDEAMVQLFLDAKQYGHDVGINTTNSKRMSRTPLMFAIEQKSTNIAQALLKHPDIQPQINASDTTGWTALSLAAWFGNEEVAMTLLSMPGIHINAAENEGKRSPLIIAAERGNTGIVKALLQNGAKPNSVDSKKRTAVFMAVEKGRDVVLQTLIEANADLSCKDEDDRTVVHAAAENGYDSIVELLVSSGLQTDDVDKFKMTPLHRACQHGHLAAVEALVELDPGGTTLSMQDEFHRTPFDVAWQYGRAAIMKLCSVEDENQEPSTTQDIELEELPIWSLVRSNHRQQLIDAKTHREAEFAAEEPVTGFTALHCAMAENNDDDALLLLKILLNTQAKKHLNKTDPSRQTPLHIAARRNHIECTKILLKQQPELEMADRFGCTPLTVAYRHQNWEVAVALLDAGAKIGSDSYIDPQRLLFASIEFKSARGVVTAMKSGAYRTMPDEYGRTPDMLANKYGNHEILSALQTWGSFRWTEECKKDVTVLEKEVKDSVNQVSEETKTKSVQERLRELPSPPIDTPVVPFRSPKVEGSPWIKA